MRKTHIDSFISLAEPSLNWREYFQVFKSLKGGWLTQSGSQVGQMEQELTDYLFQSDQPDHKVVAVSNGTTALHLALLALGIGSGDEVIVPNYSYIAVANSVCYVGARVVPCDVKATSGCIDPKALKDLISERTKAIIVVDNYGVLADYEAIRAVAGPRIPIIQDAAESFPGPNEKLKYGNQGDVSTFSFYANKVLTSGEGGAVRGPSEFLSRVNYLKSQAQIPGSSFKHGEVGFNYRITNLQAAIFNAQWKKLQILLIKRNRVFRTYVTELRRQGIDVLNNGGQATNPWLFCVFGGKLDGRLDELRSSLRVAGIETRPGFTPIAKHKFFQVDQGKVFPNSDKLASQTLSLPTYPDLTTRQVRFVVTQLKMALEHIE
jgi:perosamine synthetase